ncbi:threonine synthase [Halobacteria archaeon AArc-curdl1]|uniref:Threonine synthase n=1 Tax=Natronosalvus hydrolyticus TaxID=2979988 RepID=A0AAP3E6R9_9EURY|nr:threonine synthase [Halobacteria archaeon AArc-curdl1]
MTLERRCYACGVTTDQPYARCDCGEPLWFAVQPLEAWPALAELTGSIWRYEDVLPVEQPAGDLAPGATPLLSVPGLREETGLELWLKDEGRNPTGSFKDRGSAVGVGVALERAHEASTPAGDPARVATVSHGNMALSTAACAAAAGLEATVFVPEDIAGERLAAIGAFEPEIVRVRGDYGRLYHDALELGARHGVTVCNSDVPSRVAGQKTLAFELLEAVPDLDAIVLPVSSGGNASAVWKGLLEMRAGGLCTDLPALYLVQATACDPIARAYRASDDVVTPIDDDADTVAYSIANADPPSGTRALAAVRDTGGAVVSVDDDAILTAQRRLASVGIRVEPSSATTLAAITALCEGGALKSGDRVAGVLTGRGYGGSGGEPETTGRTRDTLDTVFSS